jgi:DNA-binding transcriptional regulator YdaS (Cro superfamily)
MQVLQTHEEVITALGGPSKLGRLLGCSPQRVNNWRVREKFSPEFMFLMLEALRDTANATAPSRLWGVPTPNEIRGRS